MPGYVDFLQRLQHQKVLKNLNPNGDYVSHGHKPDYQSVARGIAARGGKVQESDTAGFSVPQFVDAMSMVPFQMESQAVDRRTADTIARSNASLYPAPPPGAPPGAIVMHRLDTVAEKDIPDQRYDGPSHQAVPLPLVPSEVQPTLPRSGSRFRAPPMRSHPDPVQRAYGHINDAIDVYGAERAIGALAQNHQNPYEYAQLLAGQLDARRRQVMGSSDPSVREEEEARRKGAIVLDPVMLGAYPGSSM